VSKVLFKGAFVMSCNDEIGDLEAADVLVEGARIAQVGADLAAADAEVIDAAGMLLMPGMADTHSHLWEAPFKGRVTEAWGWEYFTNMHPLVSWLSAEDLYTATYAGAVESLAAGVTSMFDYCTAVMSPEHADAAIAGLRDAGIRAVFGYDLRGADPGRRWQHGPSGERFADLERVKGSLADDDDMMRLAICLSEVTPENLDRAEREIAFARELGCRMSWHNNKGGEIVLLHERGLLGPDMLPAHGNYTTDEDLELLGAVGGHLTSQPEAETYAGRRSMTMIGRGHRRGVRIALGVDVPAIMNLGLLPQMRLLYLLQRYIDGMHERLEAQVPVARRPGVPTLTVRDIVRFATVNGQSALGVEDTVGQIAPGFQADLILMDTRTFGRAEGDPAGHVVLNSSAGDVDTVMVAGKLRKRDRRMVGVDTGKLLADREAVRDRAYAGAGETIGRMTRTHWEWSPQA